MEKTAILEYKRRDLLKQVDQKVRNLRQAKSKKNSAESERLNLEMEALNQEVRRVEEALRSLP